MHIGQVGAGLGLAAWGVAWYLGARRLASDANTRRMAQRRWRLDRLMSRKFRRGEMSKDEWFERFGRQYRMTVRWVFTPAVALWLALCLTLVVKGILS